MLCSKGIADHLQMYHGMISKSAWILLECYIKYKWINNKIWENDQNRRKWIISPIILGRHPFQIFVNNCTYYTSLWSKFNSTKDCPSHILRKKNSVFAIKWKDVCKKWKISANFQRGSKHSELFGMFFWKTHFTHLCSKYTHKMTHESLKLTVNVWSNQHFKRKRSGQPNVFQLLYSDMIIDVYDTLHVCG